LEEELEGAKDDRATEAFEECSSLCSNENLVLLASAEGGGEPKDEAEEMALLLGKRESMEDFRPDWVEEECEGLAKDRELAEWGKPGCSVFNLAEDAFFKMLPNLLVGFGMEAVESWETIEGVRGRLG
jgi:hypothetical protein